MNDNTARILDLESQENQLMEQIRILSSQPVVDLNVARELTRQKEALDLEIAQLKKAQEEQQRKVNNNSVMQFLQTEHFLQDLDDYNAASKERIASQERQAELKKESLEARNNELTRAKQIRERVIHIHLCSYYYPKYSQDNIDKVTGFDTIGEIYYAKDYLENFRDDIKSILEQVAGFDFASIGYLKNGIPWATSKLDVQKLYSLSIALGLIPDPRKPKLIEIEENENFGRR